MCSTTHLPTLPMRLTTENSKLFYVWARTSTLLVFSYNVKCKPLFLSSYSFETKLCQVFSDLNATYKSIQGHLQSENFKVPNIYQPIPTQGRLPRIPQLLHFSWKTVHHGNAIKSCGILLKLHAAAYHYH